MLTSVGISEGVSVGASVGATGLSVGAAASVGVISEVGTSVSAVGDAASVTAGVVPAVGTGSGVVCLDVQAASIMDVSNKAGMTNLFSINRFLLLGV